MTPTSDEPTLSETKRKINTEAILGASGTGKSTLLRERIAQDASYALLTAPTGIAAVNLGPGVTTVHSALGFYDLRSLRDRVERGQIADRAVQLAKRKYKNLVLDEVSMVSAEHLQLIHDGFEQAREEIVNSFPDLTPTGIILSGDFCQLSPVQDDPNEPVKFAFESDRWEMYETGLTHLTEIHRQPNPVFQAALNLARRGQGVEAAIALKKAGAEFLRAEDDTFDGITLYAVNSQVDNHNQRRLEALPGPLVEIESERWGRPRGEWKNIPEVLELKDGALVMVLINEPKTFSYVNGDLATLTLGAGLSKQCMVETKRGYVGEIPFTIRRNVSFAPEDSRERQFLNSAWRELAKDPPKQCGDCEPDVDHGFDGAEFTCPKCGSMYRFWGKDGWVLRISPSLRWWIDYQDYMEAHTMRGEPFYEPRERGTVVGEVRYMPLRLAYASSYHKVQGLTLDKVQISMNHFWASKPGMLYVALSRVRSVEGLKIIGDVSSLSRKIKTDPRVMRWV